MMSIPNPPSPFWVWGEDAAKKKSLHCMKTRIPPLRHLDLIPFEEDDRPYVILRDPLEISESPLAISEEALILLSFFDGHHSVEQTASELSRMAGSEYTPAQILEFVTLFDEALLLHNDRFEERRSEIERAFLEGTYRDPILVGSGYPESAPELHAFLDQLMETPDDPDLAFEEPDKTKGLRGAILPHIDFHRGGATYGRTYRRVKQMLPPAEDGPLLVVILGVSHQGTWEPVVGCTKRYRTPLGEASFSTKALQVLAQVRQEALLREQFVHRSEHSVELQLVWLQHILRDRPAEYLPLLVGAFGDELQTPATNSGEVQEVLAILKAVEEGHPGPVLWIASVDLAHVGPAFGDDIPIDKRQAGIIARKDLKLLEQAIKISSADRWWETILEDGNKRRICGLYATYLLLKHMEGANGSLIDYQQAIAEGGEQMVTYASALFQ